MFKNLKKKLSGVLSLEELTQRSETYIEQLIAPDEADSDFGLSVLDENLDLFEEWRESHRVILGRIAAAANTSEQLLYIRKEIVELIETSQQASFYIGEELSDKYKRLLAKEVHPDSDYDEMMATWLYRYILSDASCRCLRLLSMELGDARKGDWFEMYKDVYRQYAEFVVDSLIRKGKGESVDVHSTFVHMSKTTMEAAREKVLQGYNWEYDANKEHRKNE